MDDLGIYTLNAQGFGHCSHLGLPVGCSFSPLNFDEAVANVAGTSSLLPSLASLSEPWCVEMSNEKKGPCVVV